VVRRTVVAVGVLLLAGCSGSSATRYRGAPGTASPVPTAAAAGSPAAVAAPTGARPVAPVRFRFGVGDEVAVSVWKEPELSTSQRILADGTISPPLLRPTPVLGTSVEELQARLTDAYREYLKEPKVSVRVVSIHADRVFVLGEVKTPQAVSVVGPTTVVQAIVMSGGFLEEFADKRRVQVLRVGPDGRPAATFVNADAVLAGCAHDVPIQRGDVVFVPARGVTEFSRTVGQALAPLGTAIGAGTSVAALIVAGNQN
jgi:polysaccharide biosynthesis/export protein